MSTATYDGKPCRKCGSNVRYQSSQNCVSCCHNKWRKWKYGVTPQQVTELKRKQDYKCAICRSELPQEFVVDHSHVSGEVRGLLCRSCNLVIGWAKDSSSICESASQYLKNQQ